MSIWKLFDCHSGGTLLSIGLWYADQQFHDGRTDYIASAKALKGSWTHVPDIASVLHVLERSRSCLVLVDSVCQPYITR